MKSLDINVGGNAVTVLVQEHDGKPYFAVRPVCEALAIDFKSQLSKLKSNPQFSCGDITTVAGDGRQRDMVVLPVEEMGMWLCNINARRVKPEIREKLIAFQKHMQVVIHMHMGGFVSRELVEALRTELEEAKKAIQYLLEKDEKRDSLYFGNAARTLNFKKELNKVPLQ